MRHTAPNRQEILTALTQLCGPQISAPPTDTDTLSATLTARLSWPIRTHRFDQRRPVHIDRAVQHLHTQLRTGAVHVRCAVDGDLCLYSADPAAASPTSILGRLRTHAPAQQRPRLLIAVADAFPGVLFDLLTLPDIDVLHPDLHTLQPPTARTPRAPQPHPSD